MVFPSCVQINQCDGDGLFDVRGAEKFTCKDYSQICCHQSKLKIDEAINETISEDAIEGFDYYDDLACSSLEEDGYR